MEFHNKLEQANRKRSSIKPLERSFVAIRDSLNACICMELALTPTQIRTKVQDNRTNWAMFLSQVGNVPWIF